MQVTAKQPKAKSGLTKQLLTIPQAEKSCGYEQLMLEVINEVGYKKSVKEMLVFLTSSKLLQLT